MLLAVDVDYRDSRAHIAGISFTNWEDAKPKQIYHCVVEDVKDYEPGKFYQRELPCIIRLLHEHTPNPDVIIIDGFVYLGAPSRLGLGMHLYNELKGGVPVIGVAKKLFRGTSRSTEIFRGGSSKPLFITSVGLDLEQAKQNIIAMYGKHRLPDLLKIVDHECRNS